MTLSVTSPTEFFLGNETKTTPLIINIAPITCEKFILSRRKIYARMETKNISVVAVIEAILAGSFFNAVVYKVKPIIVDITTSPVNRGMIPDPTGQGSGDPNWKINRVIVPKLKI